MRPCARAPPTDARLPECARKRVQRVLARLSALGLRDGHTAGGAPAWRRRRCARVQPLRMRLRGGLRARRRSCMRGAGRARWEFHSAHPLSEHSARPRARARKCGPNIPPLPPARSLPLTLPPPPPPVGSCARRHKCASLRSDLARRPLGRCAVRRERRAPWLLCAVPGSVLAAVSLRGGGGGGARVGAPAETPSSSIFSSSARSSHVVGTLRLTGPSTTT